MQLVGRHMGDSAHQALISPDWDFNQMGIGGLDKEFSDIFRRAFASRVFPPDVVEQMGMKHVRGILLYGPPGECHAPCHTPSVTVCCRYGQDLDGQADRQDVTCEGTQDHQWPR